MIGSSAFATVFGAAPSGDPERITNIVKAAIRHGFSPVLLKPGGKEPPCILAPATAKREDQAAQARRLAEHPSAQVNRVRHACGLKHVLDDPAKVGPIVQRVLTNHGGLNLGIHLGRSRRIVVDVDTPAEREAFRESWVQSAPGVHEPPRYLPGITVESPGRFDVEKQEWVHWGGGHWIFTVPDDFEFPAGKVFKGPGGWAAMWGESYVLVPPSVRAEGPYRLVGGETPAPAWLLEQITEHGRARAAQEATVRGQAARGGPIDVWSASVDWATLLEPLGWLETSLSEGSCGCPIWTAPGGHASPKSATAHDVACQRFDVAEGWGPLKIWTDHPPEGLPPEGMVTKLQFVAAVEHGGDVGAAARALGIERVASAWAVPDGWTQSPKTVARELSGSDPFGTPGGPPPDPSEPPAGQAEPGAEESPTWASVDLGPFLDGSYVEPSATFMPRSDGVCLLYAGLTHSIHGESESGKSWIAQVECARLVRMHVRVLYVDFESDPGPVVGRLLLLGCSPEEIRLYFDYRRPEKRPGADHSEYGAWLQMFDQRYALAIIDGVTDAMGIWQLSTKDNDEYAGFAKAFPRQLASRTGAAVVLIDHVTKSQDGRGRFAIGAQAKMTTLDGAAYVVDVVEPLGKGLRGVLEIRVGKDRPGSVRAHGGVMRADRTQLVGEFVLDSSAGLGIMAGINPPTDERVVAGQVADARVSKIRDYLIMYPGESLNAIAAGTGIRKNELQPLLAGLEAAGDLVVERVGQKHTHQLITPIFGAPGSQQ